MPAIEAIKPLRTALTSMKPSHILLAEDDADDRDLFMEALSVVDPSIRLVMVDDGEKLLDHLDKSTDIPDWIFLDLNMPKKNGKECLTELKRNGKTQEIPVVIYTTSLNSRDIDETFNRGAACFIRKPASFKELTSILNKCIAFDFAAASRGEAKRNFVLR